MKSIVLYAVLLFFIPGFAVQAQELRSPWSVIDQGGGRGSGGNLFLHASIGQPLTEGGTGSDLTLRSGFIPGVTQFASLMPSFLSEISSGWNLISIPVTVSDFSKGALYPTAVSQAFVYEGSYVPKSTLSNRIGFWLKFGEAQSVGIAGFPRVRDTVDVVQGWNILGSISEGIPVAQLSSIPPGMTTSPIFRYDGAYVISDSVYPGKGHWIKVSADGKIVLAASGAAGIRIVPTNELPPAPPEAADGNPVPREFALEQNFPNPFNPATVVHYQVPQRSHVTIRVYDVLGREVALLVDDVLDAGYRSIDWNADGIPSGVYFYRLIARGVEGGSASFIDSRKMLIVR